MSEFPPSHEGSIQYFRRKGSDNIHVRFSVHEQGKSKQVRLSTGETDYARAKVKAGQLYKKYLGRAEAGQRLSSTSFRKTAGGFIDELEVGVKEGDVKHDAFKQTKSRVERFFVGFFQDAPIEEIAQAHIDNYVRWRRVYWTSGPGKKEKTLKYKRGAQTITSTLQKGKPSHATLIKEINTLRSIFDYAVRVGVLSQQEKLPIKPPRGNVGRRPGFEDHEIRDLLNHLLKRIEEPNISVDERLKRYQLWAYVHIACGTGMRPSEIVNLKWNQVFGYFKGKEVPLKKLLIVPEADIDIRFTINDSKRGRPRRIVPRKVTSSTVLNLWEFSGKPTGKTQIFADRFGDPVRGFGRQLRNVFQELGIKETATGERRTPYSFRHYYITEMLRSTGKPDLVALNVGTSIEMIERFYWHGEVERGADELAEF